MLQKTKMVTLARKAVEALYEGRCSVFIRQKVKKPNHSTGFQEVSFLENEPCRLSFRSLTTTSSTETLASAVSQTITLFIRPELTIPSGSKIEITQNGTTTVYTSSGQPSIYITHQELSLELFKGWS